RSGECRQTKSPRRSLARAGQLLSMMALCGCFARRVKFDEKVANRVRRIRTVFAIRIAATEKLPRIYQAGLRSLRPYEYAGVLPDASTSDSLKQAEPASRRPPMYFVAAVLAVLSGLFYAAGNHEIGSFSSDVCRYGSVFCDSPH